MPQTRLERLFEEKKLNAGHGRILRELLGRDWRKNLGQPRTRSIRQCVIHTEEREDYKTPLEERPWEVNEKEGGKLHVSAQEAEPLLNEGIIEFRSDGKNALKLSDDWKKEVQHHFSIGRLVQQGLIDPGHLRVLKLLLYPEREYPDKTKVNVLKDKTKGYDMNRPIEKRFVKPTGRNECGLYVMHEELEPLFKEGIIHAPPRRGLQVHPSWADIVTDFLREEDEPPIEDLIKDMYPQKVDPALAKAFMKHFEGLLRLVELRDVRGTKQWQFRCGLAEYNIKQMRKNTNLCTDLKQLFKEGYKLFHADSRSIIESDPALANLPREQFDQVTRDMNAIKSLLKEHEFPL